MKYLRVTPSRCKDIVIIEIVASVWLLYTTNFSNSKNIIFLASYMRIIMDKSELFDKTEKCDIIRKLENKKI